MKNQKLQLINRGTTKNVQTNSCPPKVSEMATKVIDKIMMISGTIAVVWILAFLMVAMFAK
ncbi:MAG: hypothetical protein N2B58_00870 [Desulfobacterales bacterium]|jgi:hypothetical protein